MVPLHSREGLSGEGPAAERVRRHYDRLAPTYAGKANRACNRAYRALLLRHLHEAGRVLEVGAGSSDLLATLEAPFKVACDYTVRMLSARGPTVGVSCLAADGARMPCADASFDAVFSINLLEHVSAPRALLAEARRVLVDGGLCVVVTPNGDHERLLDVLEWLHAKLPEGPHRFLTFAMLEETAAGLFEIVEHRRFLAFPAGPDPVVRAVDRLCGEDHGWGLFQYAVLRKGSDA